MSLYDNCLNEIKNKFGQEGLNIIKASREKYRRSPKVVNVKVAHIRPRYDNLKIWDQNPDNVYIARGPGPVFIDGERYPKKSSPFENPYTIKKHGTREEVVEKYRNYIIERLRNEPGLRAQLYELKGKNLGCWCAPELCHGHVLVELIDILFP